MELKRSRKYSILFLLSFICVLNVWSQNQLSNQGVFFKIPASNTLAVIGSNADVLNNSSSLEISGTITVEGSVTNDNNSTIDLQASATASISVDLNIDTNSDVILGLAATLSVDGNILNDNGSSISSNGLINIKGNWTNNSTSQLGDGDANYNAVNFLGSSIQTIGGTSESYFENITVDNGSNLSLASNIRVDQNLEFTNGIVQTGIYNLHINNTALSALTNFSASKYINGNLRRNVTAGNVYPIPIGTATNYEYLDFELLSSSGLSYVDFSFTIDGTQTPPGGLQVNSTDIDQFTDYGYWSLTPDAGTYVYDVTTTLIGHSDLGGTSDQYSLISDIGSGWSDNGIHSLSTQGYNAAYIVAKRLAMQNGGDFIVGYATSALYSQPTITNELKANGATLKIPASLTVCTKGANADVTLSNSGSIKINGTLRVEGDWTNDGNASLVNGDATNKGTVIFAGNAAQAIGGSTQTQFEQFEINNTNDINITNSPRVDEKLILTDGLIHTGANRVYVYNSASNPIEAYSETSYINGNLRQKISSTNSYPLPVGDGSVYELATLKFNSATNLSFIDVNFTQDGTQTPPGFLTVDGALVSEFLDYGYWSITPDDGYGNYDLTVRSGGHTNGGDTPDRYSLITRIGSNWENYGTHSSSTQSFAGSYIIAKRTNLTSFGDYIVGKTITDSYTQPTITNQLNNVGTIIKLADSEQLYVLGTVAELNNVNAAKISLNNSAILNVAGAVSNTNTSTIEVDGMVSLAGNLLNSGTASLIKTGGNSGIIEFAGISNQTISGSSVSEFENLVINNPTHVNLDQNLITHETITLANGLLNTDGNTLINTNTGNVISGFDDTKYIVGSLRKYITTGIYDFPLGTTNEYEYASVEFLNTTGLTYIDIRFVENHSQTPPSTLTVNGALISEILNYGYWTITPDNAGNSEYNISIQSSGHTNGGVTADRYSVITDYSGSWEDYGTHSSSTQQVDGNNVLAVRSNLNEYGNYSIGKADEDSYVQPAITNVLKSNGTYIKLADSELLYVLGSDSELNNDNSALLSSENSSEIVIEGNVLNDNSSTFQIDGTLSLAGNFTNNATAGLTKVGGNTGTIIFNGAALQTIAGSSTSIFENLSISNAAGVEQDLDLQVTENVSFTNGILNTNGNIVELTNTGSVLSGYDETKYISGIIRKYVALGTFNFPLGTADKYELATVEFTDVTGVTYVDASFIQDNSQVPPPTLTVGGAWVPEFLNYGYWNLTPDNAGSSIYNISIQSSGHSNGGGTADKYSVVTKYGGSWEDYGVHSASTQQINGDYILAKRSDLSEYGSYIIAKADEDTYVQPAISNELNNNGTYFKLSENELVYVLGSDSELTNDNSAALTVNNGSHIRIQGSVLNNNSSTVEIDGTLSLEGNLTNNATAAFINLGGDKGTVILNGSLEQEIGGSTLTEFENVIFDNVDGFLLNEDIQIDDLLTITNGVCNTDVHKVILTNTGASLIGYDVNSYIAGNIRQFTTTGNYYLPLGTTDKYEFAQIDFTNVTGLTYIDAFFVEDHSQIPPPTLTVDGAWIPEFLNYGYWTIIPDNAGSSEFDLSIQSLGHSNGGGTADLYSVISNYSGNWEDYGTHAASTQQINDSLILAKRSNLSEYGNYIIAKADEDSYIQPPLTNELQNSGTYLKIPAGINMYALGSDADINNKNSAELVVHNTSILYVEGDVNNLSSAAIKLDGILQLSGNWSNMGESSLVLGDGTNLGTVLFNGTTEQILDGSTLTEFENLTLNNAANITMNSVDQQVDGVLNFTSGLVNTQSNKIIVANTLNTSIINYDATKYINGVVRRYVSNGVDYDFPIGTADFYELVNVDLTSSTGLSYLDVLFTQDNTQTPPSGLDVDGAVINELLNYGYWTMNSNVGMSAIEYDIVCTSSGHTNGLVDTDNLALIADIGSGWEDYGTHSTQSISGIYTSSQRLNMTQLGSYIIGASNDPTYPQAAITDEFRNKGAYIKLTDVNPVRVSGPNAEFNNSTTGLLSISTNSGFTVEGNVNNENSATLSIDGTLALTKEWTNNATASLNLSTGSGQIEFNGVNAQNISGSTLTRFENLKINNSNNVSLNGVNASISNVLEFSTGLLNTNANTIIVTNTNTNTITGYDETKYINGSLRQYVSNTTYNLPIGTADFYELAQLTLTSATNLNYIDINYTLSDENPVAGGTTVSGIAIHEYLDYGYWSMSGEAGFSNLLYDISFTNRGHTDAGASSDKYAILSQIPNTASWDDNGTHSSSTQVYDAEYVSGVRSGLTDFGDYILAKSLASLYFQPLITDELHNKGANIKITDNNPIKVSGLGTELKNSSNGTISIASTAQVTVDGSINNEATASINIDGTLTLTKNWTNNGTAALDLGAGTGVVKFNGTANQTISGSSISEFENIEIDNLANLDLSGVDAQVNNVITFTNGILNTGIQKILVTNTNPNALFNYNENSYINGNLRRFVGINSYDLPVGTADNYELATISIISATDLNYVDINYNQNNENPAVGITVQNIAINEFLDYGYWSFEGESGFSNLTYSLSLLNKGHTDIGGPADKYAIVSKIPNTSSWDDNGSHSASTQEYTASTVLAERMALTNFGDFIIGKSLAAIYYQPTITEELRVLGANFKILDELSVYGTNAELNNQSGGSIQIPATGNISVFGDVNNLTASTLALDGTLSISKNWSNNGTPSISLGAGSGSVNFTGTTAQVISGSSISEFDNLTINNTNGLTLSVVDAIVNETLTFSDGLFNTGVQKLIVANNAAGVLIGFDENKYINGNLRRYVSTGIYQLPIGTSSNYEHCELNIVTATNLNYVDVGFSESDENPVTPGVAVNDVDINEYLDYGYWSLTGEPGFSDLNYSINTTMRGHTDLGSPPDKYAILSKIPNTNSWDDNGIHSTSTQVYNTDYITAERSNLNEFGDYIIGKGLATLFLQPTITEELHIKGANFKLTDDNPVSITGLAAALNNSTNGIISVAAASNMIVNGSVNNLVTGTISLDGTLALTQNWTNNGTAGLSLGGSFGTVELNGSADQNIEGSIITEFENLIINNGNDLVLSGIDAQINNTLTLTDGMITTGAHKIIVANTASSSIVNYTDDKYIKGNLRRYVNTGTYDLPVGTDLYYQLATLNINSHTGLNYLDVSFIESTESAPPGLKIDNTNVVSFLDYGYWSLNSDGGESAVNYDITLRSGGHTNGGGIPQYYTVVTDIGNGWGEYGTHDNGTQSFDGSYISASKTAMNSSDPDFFGNFIVGKFGDYSQPTITNELRIRGAKFNVFSGSFALLGTDADVNNESGTLTFNASTNIMLDGDLNNESVFSTQANLELNGDWINNMTLSNSVGNITFAGSSSQTIGGSQVSTFNQLTINKISNDVALANNIEISSQINLLLNDLVIGDYDLTLADGVTISAPGDNSSYIQTNGTGSVIQEYSLPLPGAITLPIGDENNNYSPVDFTFNSGSLGAAASVSFSVSDLVHPDIESSTAYITRYWTFEPFDIAPPINYDITLHYVDADVNGIESDMQFAKYSAMMWEYGGTVNAGSNTLSLNGASSFSDGTGSTDPTALPIDLIDFSAYYAAYKHSVMLSWVTASEINNNYFTIEKSLDGVNFVEIRRVNGAGNSQTILNYSAIDSQIDSYIMYYRLKQTDYDGKYEYSKVISIQIDNSSSHEYFVNLYPNPVESGEDFYFNVKGLNSNEDVKIEIRNINGSLLFNQNTKSDIAGQVFEKIGLKTNFHSGVYILSGTTNSQIIKKLFIIIDAK